MRLYEDEKLALNEALAGVDDEVYLFGSRVDDSKKGGDIDILIYSKQDRHKLSQTVAIKFLMATDSRLDVVVFDKDKMTKEQKAFVKTLNLLKLPR